MDWGAIIQAATAAAQVAGAAAQARAAGRAKQAELQQVNDRTAQQGYGTDKQINLSALADAYNASLGRAGGVLNEQAANLAAARARAAQAVHGDVLANAQDATISGVPRGVTVPTISGGLRPSMFSGDTRALGAALSRQALLGQLDAPPTPYSSLKPLDVSSITAMHAPGATPLPTGNALDSILANIGLYGSLGGAVNQGLNQPQTPPWLEMRGNKTTPSTVE